MKLLKTFKSNLSRKSQFLIGIILALFIMLIVLLAYVNLGNLNVNSQIRIQGVIYDMILKADDEDSLIKLSKTSSKNIDYTLKKDESVITEERVIERDDGSELRVLVFKPVDVKPNATALLWIHGGGYALGSAYTQFDIAKSFIESSNTVVISPEYRLSTEAPYPAALNDCYDTLKWIVDNADDLTINKDQIFVGGESAGGGLTAALSLYARDKQEVKIAFQMPLCPMINDKMNTPSAIENHELVWDSKRNRAGWRLYLGDLYGSNYVPKYAAAMRETDFSDLPPAYTYVSDLDPFYDDTLGYINNLKASHVEVTYNIYKNAYHGFLNIAPKAEISKEARKNLLDAYQYATEHYFSEQG